MFEEFVVLNILFFTCDLLDHFGLCLIIKSIYKRVVINNLHDLSMRESKVFIVGFSSVMLVDNTFEEFDTA